MPIQTGGFGRVGSGPVGDPCLSLTLILPPRSFRSHVDASTSEDGSHVNVGPWNVPMWPEVLC